MNQNELNDEEYRRKVKRENFWYYFRIAIAIACLIIWLATEIVFGRYLYVHGFSTTRIVVVEIAWFFVYFILATCLFMSIAFCHEIIGNALRNKEKIPKEDLNLILYFIGVSIVMIGGSQTLFWLFAFK